MYVCIYRCIGLKYLNREERESRRRGKESKEGNAGRGKRQERREFLELNSQFQQSIKQIAPFFYDSSPSLCSSLSPLPSPDHLQLQTLKQPHLKPASQPIPQLFRFPIIGPFGSLQAHHTTISLSLSLSL
ncbi:hypothetical protein PanWU01x14_172230, partial [Parasponia andersonii]